jgi:hypothetical protein
MEFGSLVFKVDKRPGLQHTDLTGVAQHITTSIALIGGQAAAIIQKNVNGFLVPSKETAIGDGRSQMT